MLRVWVATSWVIFTCSNQLILVILVVTKKNIAFPISTFFRSWGIVRVEQVLLHFLHQSFVMTIIQVIIATFRIKCIIWCQCSYYIFSLCFLTEKTDFPICRHSWINNTLTDLTPNIIKIVLHYIIIYF